MKLRDYQQDILQQLTSQVTDDLVQLDTGAGKTPIEAALADHYAFVVLLAHRNLLITQMSEKLAAFGLPHDTVSTEHTRRQCITAHLREGHKNMIQRGHRHRLAVSVDSLVSHFRHGRLTLDRDLPWVIVVDEAHHVQADNKWGSLREIFPNARFIGFTATPARGDGGSLHVSSGGLFERLVQAQDLADDSVGELIRRGHLCDFDLYSPPDEELFLRRQRRAKEDGKLLISADPVDFLKTLEKKYKRRLKTVVFTPTILNAKEMAQEFRSGGFSAAYISSKQGASEVVRILDAYRSGQVQVLTNCDMVSEGFDLPGIDALFMCKTTSSFVMFRQWCGRVLRPSPGKDKALVVDFVGNVAEHGQPDDPVAWDIVTPPKGLGVLKQVPCSKCGFWFPVKKTTCPECETKNPLLDRAGMGSGYVQLERKIDNGLISRLRREHQKNKIEETLKSDLVWPYFSESGMLGKKIVELRRWAVESCVGELDYQTLNAFLNSKECSNQGFWMEHFTLADINKKPKKAVKVIKDWAKKRLKDAA